MKVNRVQENYVADNAFSIAQAHFSEEAWFCDIYAGDTPVGFVMLHDDPDKGEYCLRRFMVDARYQGQGYSKRALERLVKYVRTRPNAKELRLSYVLGEHGPPEFYRKLGFVETGEKHDGEVEMRLSFTKAGA